MFYLSLLLGAFFTGLYLGTKYNPKFSLVNNSLTFTYKGNHGERITQKIF